MLEGSSNKRINCEQGEGRFAACNVIKGNIGDHSNQTHILLAGSINNKRRRLFHGTEKGAVYCGAQSPPTNSGNTNGSHWIEDGNHLRRRLHWAKSANLEDAKYADWKISVRYYSEDDQQQETSPNNTATIGVLETDVVTYSVHRSSLGIHSKYFEKIFLSGFSERTQGESTMELPSPTTTLEHFETVLEYCYTGTVDMNPRNIISILYLSDYLRIEALMGLAQNFMKNEILRVHGGSMEKSTRLALYYQDAQNMVMHDLQEAILHICSREPQLLTKGYALAEMPDIDFWCRLWDIRKMYPDLKSQSKTTVQKLSQNLAHFFENYPTLVSLEIFRTLTHINALPIISEKVAILLMEQEQRLYFDSIKNNSHLVNRNSATDSLSCLQTRCIDALYNTKKGGWQFDTASDLLRGRLRKLSPIVTETILLKTIEFERSGQNFPKAFVSGAGSDFANGVYTMSGWFRNAMKFSKQWLYEGESRQLILYRFEGEWWISLIPENTEEPGSDEDIDIYRVFPSDEREEQNPLPPLTGWGVASGLLPAPCIHLLSKND
mmetsp:Transcript_13856/g.28103  ORF Transcript_13856/g.28103 Transcript_13856/m.28103 type:complete len:550 (-) Transcript_13856:473-2122(-)